MIPYLVLMSCDATRIYGRGLEMMLDPLKFGEEIRDNMQATYQLGITTIEKMYGIKF